MSYGDQHCGQLQNAEFKFDAPPALGSVAEGKAKSAARIAVSFVGYRVHLLDPDNFAGSCKDLLDGLRHAGLIPDDTAGAITFQTEQERVRKYKEEKTGIKIVYP